MKTFFILLILIFALSGTISFAQISIDGAIENQVPENIMPAKDTQFDKENAKKELAPIEKYLKKMDISKTTTIDKNGKTIYEINSDSLNQENNRPVFYVTEYSEKPFNFDPKEKDTFQTEGKLFSINNSIFRFKIINPQFNTIDLSFDGGKIKLKSQNNYALTENNVKLLKGLIYIVNQDEELSIKISPDDAFKRVINNYKNFEIKEFSLNIKDNTAIYTINVKINGKILWFFPTSFDLRGQVNAETGITNTKKPWWEPFVF